MYSIFQRSVSDEQKDEARSAVERLRAELDAGDGAQVAVPAEALAQVLGYVEKLEQDASDLEILYSMTVEASTALENELSIRNEAVTSFLAHTSHELRTPLNAIIGHAELVMEELADEGHTGHDRDLDRIRGAAKHLLVLINDILDLSKVEAGRIELRPEHFDLGTLIRDVVNSVEPLARSNRNELDIELAPGLGSLYSDPVRVRQCLLNLVGNACKFTRAGHVHVRAWRQPDDRGEWVFIAIRDTGIGMTPEQLARVFRPYAQAHARTDAEFGGTGLGLAFTRSLCRHLSGEVKAQSEYGRGSTFTVRLPAVLD